MYEIIVFLLAPITSVIFHSLLNGNDGVYTDKLPSRVFKLLIFGFLDELILLGIIFFAEGKIDLLGYMKNNVRFTLIYLVLVFAIGVSVPFMFFIFASYKLGKIKVVKHLCIPDKIVNRIGNAITLFLSVISAIIMIYQCVDCNFWGDEAFTILRVNEAHRFLDVATVDYVNPPLYFLIFKLITLILGQNYFTYHFVSALPSLILLVFNCIFVRKKIGNSTSIPFALYLLLSLNFRGYSVEIRMYAWAACMVVLCFYEGYRIIETKGTKCINWFFFCLWGILAAYSHNFAFAGVVTIYLMVFIRLFFYDRHSWKKSLLAIFASIICYSPWMVMFIKGLKVASGEGFWINSAVSFKEIIQYIFEDRKIECLYFVILVCVVLWTYKFISFRVEKEENEEQIDKIKSNSEIESVVSDSIVELNKEIVVVELNTDQKQEKDIRIRISTICHMEENDSVAWMMITMFMAVLMIFFVEGAYGILIKPVFVLRYIYPVGVAVWLSLSMGISIVKNKHWRQFLAVIVSIMIVFSFTRPFFNYMKEYSRQGKDTVKVKEMVDSYIDADSTLILTNSIHLNWTVLDLHFPGIMRAWADPNTEYDLKTYGKDIKYVVMWLGSSLSEDSLSLYEKSFGVKPEFIGESSFSGSYVYLYVITLE